MLLGALSGATPAAAMNCVAYVKAVTGFNLFGDAWQWWGAATNLYERGYNPAPGAVMVFSRTGRMHVGHVAVVRQVLGPREIRIDQANWHHGRIDHDVGIHDLSPNNDWSSVEVEWSRGVYGGPFPITGFVYAPGTPLPEHHYYERERAPRLVEASGRVARGHVVLAGGLTQSRHALTTHAASHPAVTHAVAAASHPAVLQSKKPAQAPRSKPVVYRGGAAKPAAAPAR
jgi:surface antigen